MFHKAIRGFATTGVVAALAVGGLSAAPAMGVAGQTPIVSDTFSRTVAEGFGSATTGGAYTHAQPKGMSVNGSQGVMNLTESVARNALVGPSTTSNVDVTNSFGLSALPTSGGGVYLSQMLRTNAAGAYFAPRVRIMTDRSVRVGLRYADSSGSATAIGDDSTAAFTAAAGSRIMVRSQAEGSSPTTLRVKAWLQGSPEPTAWMVTSASSALPSAGAFGVWAYVAGGTNATSVTVDDVSVVPMAAANVLPTARFTTAQAGLKTTFDASGTTDSDGTITSYAWDFGDGSTGAGQAVTKTYGSVGTYTAKLTVTDDSGGSNSVTRQVVATATPAGAARPSALNTGVPPGTALTVVTGDLTITTPGAVVDAKDVRGVIRVKAPNVTIKRSIVRGGATPSAGVGLIMATTSGASNVLVQDVTLAPTTPSVYIDGVKVNQSGTFTRLNISRTVDGFSIYGDGVKVENSYVHDLSHFASDPAQGGGPSHDDAVQVLGGTGIRILGNTLQGAYNAAVMINEDTGVTRDLTVSSNWLDGGMCSVNYASDGPYKTGMHADYNRFGRSQRLADCAIIHNSAMSDLAPIGNVWDDNGQPAGVKRGA